MIDLLWNNPISEAKMSKYIESLALLPTHQVVDIGCGCGELLIRLVERYQVQGIGIDNSKRHIAEANRRAKERRVAGRVKFQVEDAVAFHHDREPCDLAICIGSSHAFGLGSGAYENAIHQMIPVVVPGGSILIGEGYLKQPAAPDYRELLGDSVPDTMTHAANVASGADAGLVPLSAWTSSIDEWDDFEWNYQRTIERAAERTPGDQAAIEKRARRREWMDAYLRWGRDTLGFGVYWFRKPVTNQQRSAD